MQHRWRGSATAIPRHVTLTVPTWMAVFVKRPKASDKFWAPALLIPPDAITAQMPKCAAGEQIVQFFRDCSFGTASLSQMAPFIENAAPFVHYATALGQVFLMDASVRAALEFVMSGVVPAGMVQPGAGCSPRKAVPTTTAAASTSVNSSSTNSSSSSSNKQGGDTHDDPEARELAAIGLSVGKHGLKGKDVVVLGEAPDRAPCVGRVLDERIYMPRSRPSQLPCISIDWRSERCLFSSRWRANSSSGTSNGSRKRDAGRGSRPSTTHSSSSSSSSSSTSVSAASSSHSSPPPPSLTQLLLRPVEGDPLFCFSDTPATANAQK